MNKLLLTLTLLTAIPTLCHAEELAAITDDTTIDQGILKTQIANTIEKNDVEAFKRLLLTPGFDINSPLPVYQNAPALVYATSRKRTAIAQSILSLPETDPNVADMYGDQGFNLAIQTGNLPLVKAYAANPKIEMDSDNVSPFFEAAIAGNVEIVKFLMKDPRSNYAKRTSMNLNALYLAASNSGAKIIPILLATKKFDVNLRLKYDGTTALHRACDHPQSNAATILALLEAPNINPNIKDKAGKTPLDRAAATDMRFVQALLTSKKVVVTKANRIQIEKLKLKNSPAK